MAKRALRAPMRAAAQSLPLNKAGFRRSLAIAVFCAALATLARLGLDHFTPNLPFVTFFPAVVAATLWGGLWAGLASVVLSLVLVTGFLGQAGAVTVANPVRLGVVLFVFAAGAVLLISALFRLLIAMQRESEERAQVMAREMRHRTNNLLAIVQAISSQTARSSASLADYQKTFGGRLVAMARAHDLVAQSPGQPVDLKSFLQSVLEPFGGAPFHFAGPDAHVPPNLAASLGLLVHELGTNAMKYGALSVPEGTIALDWTQDDRRVTLCWTERNGPGVKPPSRSGFGTRLLRSAFPPEKGEVQIAYPPEGVRCVIAFTRDEQPLG